MADIKWIKITTDVFEDEKIKLIDSMPDRDAVLVIWFKLLTLAGKRNQGGLLFFYDNMPYTDEMLGTIFNRPVSTVRYSLDIFCKFGMIEIAGNDLISIPNWSKHQNIEGMEKVREKNRIRQRKHREKLLLDDPANSNVTSRDSNALDKNKNKKKNIYSKEFLEFWEVYPRKKNKGDAMKAWKALNPDADTTSQIMAAVEIQKNINDWTKNNGQYVPYPASWIRARGWEDEIQEQPQQTTFTYQEL